MAGESMSGRHIADKQRQLHQRAMHAGEISSFTVILPAWYLK